MKQSGPRTIGRFCGGLMPSLAKKNFGFPRTFALYSSSI